MPEPDSNPTASQEPDAAAAYLAEVRTHASRATAPDADAAERIGAAARIVAEDVPRLLAAVTEALAFADLLNTPQPGDSPVLGAAGRKLRRIIAGELLRKDGIDV